MPRRLLGKAGAAVAVVGGERSRTTCGRHLGDEPSQPAASIVRRSPGGKLPRLRQALALADRGQGLDRAAAAGQLGLAL